MDERDGGLAPVGNAHEDTEKPAFDQVSPKRVTGAEGNGAGGVDSSCRPLEDTAPVGRAQQGQKVDVVSGERRGRHIGIMCLIRPMTESDDALS